MSKFIPTNKSNPCPICQNTSGDCRSVDNLILCQKSPGGEGEHPDYQFTQSTKDGIWGIYAPRREEWTPQQKQEYREERKRQEAWRQEQKRKALEKKLSGDELDFHSRRLINSYGLSDRHREHLVSHRGLPVEQTQSFFSYDPSKPGIHLPKQFPRLWKESGIACPAFDTQEKIIGWQLRIDDKTEGSKYKWIRNPHLNNGELPITVINSIGQTSETWHLAEGVLKPFIASSRLNLPFIGSPGGLFDKSPQQLQKALGDASTVVIYPDGGDIVNKHVTQRWQRVAKFFQSLGLEVKFAWWGQRTKNDPDIDEISTETKINYLSPEKFFGLCVLNEDGKGKTPHSFGQLQNQTLSKEERSQAVPFLQELAAIQHGIKKNALVKGFSLVEPKFIPKIWNYDPETTFPTSEECQGKPPKAVFKKGQRLQTAIKIFNAGWKGLVDVSSTGLGKSNDFGMLTPDPESGGRIFYLDKNHRNPSTDTVRQNYTDLPPRHKGLYRWEDGNLKTSPEHLGDKPEISPNCHLANHFTILKNKGWAVEGQDNPICAICPFGGFCHEKTGYGYGYKAERIEALEQRQIRAHINSLPDPEIRPSNLPLKEGETEDQSIFANDTFIIEEAGELLRDSQTITGKYQDFLKQFDKIRREAPNLYQKLQLLQNKLYQLLNGEIKQGKYGLNHDDILDIIKDVIPDDIQELAQVALKILTLDFNNLLETPDSVANVGKAGKVIRSKFRKDAFQNNEEALNDLPNNLLGEMLQILAGENVGRLRVNFDKFQITLPNNRHSEFLQAADKVIFLDATLNPKDAAHFLGYEESGIVTMEQEKPDHSNHHIFVVDIQGLGSRDRSLGAQNRVNALQKKITALMRGEFGEDFNLKNLDFLGNEGIDGYWWNHSRGTNQFKGEQCLVAVGTPYKNIGQLHDEYFVRYGTLEGFDDWYEHQTSSEYLQLLGRQRSHLEPDKPFYTYLIGTNRQFQELAAKGYKVIHRKGVDLTVEAGTKEQISKVGMLRAVSRILERGHKLTQTAIAKESKLSQGRISQLVGSFEQGWGGFRKLLVSLYKQPNREINNSELPNNQELLDWIERNPIQALSDLLNTAIGCGVEALAHHFLSFHDSAQLKILEIAETLFSDSKPLGELFKRRSPLPQPIP